MGMPPLDVGEFYRVNRQRQISLENTGQRKGLAGRDIDSHQRGEGYKDANWQMKHMYEPTFTC